MVAPRTKKGQAEMLRGPGSEWSHLEQSRGGPEVLRGAGSEWSHLEQSRDILIC